MTLGQYVLTGMQNNSKKNLLLLDPADPEGVVSENGSENQCDQKIEKKFAQFLEKNSNVY